MPLRCKYDKSNIYNRTNKGGFMVLVITEPTLHNLTFFIKYDTIIIV